MKYKSIRGMEDILPEDIGIWQHLEYAARRDLESWGYDEIRTPILEDTAIFVRSIGKDTDIVKKEMYTFKDKKERSLTLRPEGTAPIVRAYIEHSLDKISPKIKKLYYIGPMFRSERPQKGRSRQFHQIGVEVIGTGSPFADTEVIRQLSGMLKIFRLKGFAIKLNSLGCIVDKEKFAAKLKEYLEEKKNRLCRDCKERTKKNVLRVLDCKNETCIQVVRQAPSILEGLCIPCKAHFEKVKERLNKEGIEFKETKNLVRGLDYYTGTVFEITHPALGAQDAIGAGGRYDNLIKDLGGPATPAIGYALGIERIILALREESALPEPIRIYIAALGEEAELKGTVIAANLRTGLERDRDMRIKVIKDIEGGALKAQMKRADKNKTTFTLILGEDEIKKKKIIIKNMKTGIQDSVDEANITAELAKRIKELC
ncbi:MAG: histidine--tRNA ligase [Candidatus Omnitrophota bacterium]